jgi:hypothetical protein
MHLRAGSLQLVTNSPDTSLLATRSAREMLTHFCHFPLALQVRLEKPQAFVNRPRDFGEQIRRVQIIQTVRGVDCGSGAGGKNRVAFDQGLQVILSKRGSDWVFRQARVRRAHAGRAERVATELRGAFGQFIGKRKHCCGKVIEEFVQLNEIRSLDIPVRLLGLRVQIEAIRKLLVQKRDQ